MRGLLLFLLSTAIITACATSNIIKNTPTIINADTPALPITSSTDTPLPIHVPPTAIPTTATSTPNEQESRGLIAFFSERTGNLEIYSMNADGSNVTNLTNNVADDLLAVWSPDGTQLAFVSDRDGDSEIYVMNADGSNVIQVTDNPASDFMPAWLPNGQIGFLSDRDGPDYEIYVANIDGSGLIRLTQNNWEELSPAWSPDGTMIAFESERDGNREIYVMQADGSGQVNLTNDASAIDIQPAWSPDGIQIAFASERDENQDIYLVNVDGSGLTRLTDDQAYDNDPDWSPDGRRIIFLSDRFGSTEILIMNVDGTGITRLTSHPPNYGPAWQRLSASPLVTSSTNSKPPVTLTPEPGTPVAAAAVTPITDFDAVSRVFESPELGITVQHPLGWEARLNLEMKGILVVDDFEAFRKSDASAYADAVGILVLSLPNVSGSADEILKNMQARSGNLSQPNDPITVEKHDGQEIAWAEYTVTSLSSGAKVHHFLAIITNGTNTAAASTIVYEDRQDEVRPIYRAIVSRVKLREK